MASTCVTASVTPHVYRTFDDNVFTILMMGEGTFTKEDYDEILEELHQHWWPENMTIRDE